MNVKTSSFKVIWQRAASPLQSSGFTLNILSPITLANTLVCHEHWVGKQYAVNSLQWPDTSSWKVPFIRAMWTLFNARLLGPTWVCHHPKQHLDWFCAKLSSETNIKMQCAATSRKGRIYTWYAGDVAQKITIWHRKEFNSTHAHRELNEEIKKIRLTMMEMAWRPCCNSCCKRSVTRRCL